MDAAFHRDGDRFVPTPLARGPWAPDSLHGGPPAGLMTRAIEQFIDDPEMQITRLTVDLFRSVPDQPLHVRVESVRGGRRLHVVQASLFADDVEVSRTNALVIRRSDVPAHSAPVPPPPGPEGFPVGGLARPMPGEDAPRPLNPGFHSSIQAAWVSDVGAEVPTGWLHVPFPLVAGEETSPIVAAASLADFGNALANMLGRATGEGAPGGSYINPDITLYVHRQPVGDWFCLQPIFRTEAEGIGRVETLWYDRLGRYGIAVQARLANPRQTWGVTAAS